MLNIKIIPPFTGAGELISMSIDSIMQKLDKKILFRSRWKMSHGGETLLEKFLQDERIMNSMQPQAVYGYFPVYREDTSLIVNDSVRWEFPEIKGMRLSDHFHSKEEGGDIIPLSAVTIGEEAVILSKQLYEKFDYAKYFLLYGLAAELTETLAGIIHARINTELGIKSSMRRSFGYPACPDLSYQKELLGYVKADRIHLHLSESNQLIPEFSTTALIIHSVNK